MSAGIGMTDWFSKLNQQNVCWKFEQKSDKFSEWIKMIFFDGTNRIFSFANINIIKNLI
jgi:hypothetical protein